MEIILIVVILIVYLIYRNLTADSDYWEKRNITFEPPIIIVGNLKDHVLGRTTIGEVYESLYKKYSKERFVGTFRMRDPDLMLKDPEDFKRVLISDFQNFQDRSKLQGNKANPLTSNLFNLHFEEWKPMRQKVSPTFTTVKLRSMVPLMLEIGEEFTTYLNNILKDTDEVDAKELMARYTTDVIGSCGFGIKTNSIMDDEAPFRKLGKKIFRGNKWWLIIAAIRMFSHRLYTFLGLSTQQEETNKFFLNLPKQIIDERVKSGIKRNDFIDQMIELRDKEELAGRKITDDFIAAQLFIFFAAGFETSSSLMSFALYELAKHPEIQDKVFEEIRSVLKKNDGKLSYDVISEMTYLDMVASETQRKYPALGTLTRVCTSKYHFPDSNVTLDKGVSVTIPLLAIHYDPKYYPEPEKFIPERFTPEAKKLREPTAYLPFGDGPRNCVGLRLGKTQSIIGLIIVLKDFSVEICSRTPSKIVFETKSLVNTARDGIYLKFKRRM